MLDINVRTEDGTRHLGVSAEELTALVRRIGGWDDLFLVIQRIPDLPDVFAQVWHKEGEEEWTVEYRDGAADRHFQALADSPDEAAAALTGWARGDDGWQDGLDWSLLDLGPAPVVPPLDLRDEDREVLEKRVREVLTAGYADRAQLAETAEDYLVTADRRPLTRLQAEAFADRLWLERVAEQEAWHGETDPERITRAFTALEAAGITAREHFTCCRTCGDAEIGEETAPGSRGFVYFHTQSTESAAAGRGLALLYGAFGDAEGATAAVGREVVAALDAVGLRTEWDGDPRAVISVTPLEWRRRLVG
ncbi:DUF6891 domain-containing protein [Streptomyces genisteinicus]|uniref:DUF6891 domain-containing protein n=1 Tax=Streptomyces genisteinicus TaxID=2768068 RepID=A0A7H0HZ99_9ACTN|nr:hypothetical protein [Streptomyces genisteinicus]QNP65865.1 hypothetical protein IAG43_25010 [Streptomyces genisteinicus]